MLLKEIDSVALPEYDSGAMPPNVSPDARIAVIEEKISRVEDRRNKADDKLDEISDKLTKIEGDLRWQGRIFWYVAGTYGAVFLAVCGWFLSSYLPQRLDERVPADLKERLARVETNLSNLQDQLKRLTPGSLNQLIPTPETPSSPRVITENLNKAARLIDVALTNGIPAEPSAIPPLRARTLDLLNRYPTEAKLRNAAVSTLVRLDGYQAASKRILEGLQPKTEAPSDTATPNKYSYLIGFGMTCTHPEAHFLGVYPPFNPEDVVVFQVQVDTCAQKMDGVNWIRDSFVGSTIEYAGGPLRLADVSFKDCKFQFGDDPKSQKALAAIKARNGNPVNLVVD